MYLVLARKYRPKNFDEVCGQKHVTDVLKKAIKEGKTAHAYLFSGPRGTGKTSVARILAKSLNCENGPSTLPCGECSICREITAGSCLDVLEIDGASNRGIDEIRNLRENVNLTPAKAAFKIYIIDEVHMLTKEACNALLKTLEEPPAYVKFLFATTEPEKIIPTILSRCQRFNFQPFRQEEIEAKLLDISRKEGFAIDEASLGQIYGFSGGSLRDALGILDQLIVNASDGKITAESVREFLGLIEEPSLDKLLALLRQGDITETVALFHRLLEEGKDPAIILDGLIKKLKDIAMGKIGHETGMTGDEEIAGLFHDVDIETLLSAVSLIIEYKERLRRENLPVVLSEILLLKITRLLGARPGTIPAAPVQKEGPTSKAAPETGKKTPAEEKISGKNTAEPEPEEKLPEPPEESPQPDAGPGEMEERWSEVLNEIKKSKPTLVAALREGIPVKLDGDTLFINFPKSFAFHKSLVEKPANTRTIEKILSRMAGREIKTSFILESKPAESLANNKEIKKIVEFFNGEIVQLEE